ncbi:MAG TPA: cysteine--tRNA ligase [Anaerolineae bacterium]|nr:cysteine--tRNA ligase [Anaerolineae bacterium]HQH39789.1 cysteine--tRNA ligase [Anaerolineae bacterium]
MALKVYNYLSREVERFKPIQPDRVSLYVCGPTVYDHSHLGHARTYIALDVIVRYLQYRGYKVRHVRNFTDVGHLTPTGEDRIAVGARREHVEPMELVETYIHSFNDDMDALGVLRPTITPRATCHVPAIITWVQDLLDRGYAYEVNGNVYFSVEKFPEYGKLSHRPMDEWQADAGGEAREDKRHPGDFALWRCAAPEHLMRWPSPWGEGYPGWHIECSVMSTQYLGETFDIHGGGLENIFPHNECEIAQAEARHGVPLAHYWLLVGSLTVNGVKMSTSLGNFLTIKDALHLYSPEALRYFVLGSHYREAVDFSRDALQAAQRGVNSLHDTLRKLRYALKNTDAVMETAVLAQVGSLEDYREDFQAAMDDDFNTPQALGILFDLVKEVNRHLDDTPHYVMGTLAAMDRIFHDLAGSVLGLVPPNLKSQENDLLIDGLMKYFLELRQEYGKAQQWDQADAMRRHLAELGILIEDGPDGPTWRLA